MLRYSKGLAPRCLTTLRATPGASWASVGAADRDEIRKKLVRDQAALCAYCQRRIRPDDTMKIEHWCARASGGEHFQWSNLLGVCKGSSVDPDPPHLTHRGPRAPAKPEPVQHCDSARGDADLFLHPVEDDDNPSPRVYLRYAGDGTVSATDPRATADVETLNLNARHLKRSRAAVLEALFGQLERRGWTTLTAELKATELTPGGHAPEHAEFLRYHLQRWLRRRSLSR